MPNLSKLKTKPVTEALHRESFMESLNLVIVKAAKMIAPYKATEHKFVVLTALTELFIEHGFSLEQALILSVKAYNA